jgi:hypothetical protein
MTIESARQVETALIPREDRYAWGKTGRELCEPHMLEVWNKTSGPFVTVDLCSSTPMLSQIWRERYRAICRGNAIQIAGSVSRNIEMDIARTPYDSLREIDGVTLYGIQKLRVAFGPKHGLERELLQSTIQELLYRPPRLRPDEYHISQLIDIVTKRLTEETTYTYHSRMEREEMKGKGRWPILTATEQGKSLGEVIQSLLPDAPVEYVNYLLRDIATHVGEELLQKMRRFTAISLDCEDPEILKRRAEGSFPSDYWNTEFFRRLLFWRSRHVHADIMPRLSNKEEAERRRQKLPVETGLPFQKESISLLTCVEGYPFFFKRTSKRYHFDFAQSVAEVLKVGGRAVFFPWSMDGNSGRDDQLRDQIVRLWEQMGLVIHTQTFTSEYLTSKMSDREFALTHMSRVFRNPSATHTLLVAEKVPPPTVYIA